MSRQLRLLSSRVHASWLRLASRAEQEEGMATAEYAIGTLAAAAFAGILLVVVKGGAIKSALTSLIQQALSV